MAEGTDFTMETKPAELERKPMDFTVERHFTDVYRQYREAHPAIREAMCLKAQFPGYLRTLQPGDLVAGRHEMGYVGFSPIEGWVNLAYYIKRDELQVLLKRPDLLPEESRQIEELMTYWLDECTAAKVRAAYTPAMEQAIPTTEWTVVEGIGFPIYRMLGAFLDFDKLCRLGLPGLRAEIEAARSRTADAEARTLYEAMLLSLETVADCCLWYAEQVEAQAGATPAAARRAELSELAGVLRHISGRRPETFYQAAQLAWLWAVMSGHRNYGRIDVYLGDFYTADLAAGRITEAKALAILQSIWRLVAARNLIYDGRFIIGGKGRRNPENADRVAMLAMEATRTVLTSEPQLTLRFYQGQNPALYEKALTVIGEGRTYPLLYNDDVNVPAVANAFSVTLEEAEHYMPFSCGEYVLDHCSYGSPNGIINLTQALIAALHGGRDGLTGRLIGLETGPAESLDTFEKVWTAYARQVEYYLDILADFQSLEHRIVGQEAPFLLTSMLYDDCIARGKGVFGGGVRYFGGTMESYGQTNAADSLTAIQEVVFEKKLLTLPELVKMLDADFAGYEQQRKWLLNAPKYGNDNDVADAMAVRVHEHVCNYTRYQRERTDLHSYLVVLINNQVNTIWGRLTGASPDGRKARTYLANANNPAPGMDRKGLTALLNSLVKLDPAIHAGAVQNMKFSKELFTTGRKQTEALLDTYWEKGSQAMITVVSKGDLEAAMQEPEKYTHIFVRVGGFSARFVDLRRETQLEVLNRTLY
ncbi:MAG TPA: pyruvate formate lyase family protein [Symbiobacteriaceae bacterium]|nr:pyruvate formate lyase family protein [Symbiobacteriaceae bacterium]